MDAQKWDEAWKTGRTPFHLQKPHVLLVKQFEKRTDKRDNLKVFFPFCGKTVDMIYLLEHGHRVVGLDCSEDAIQKFQKEHETTLGEMIKQPLGDIDGFVYRTQDDRLRLYCCDLYKYTSDLEGMFDIIWERGGLSAVNETDQRKYAEKMMSLMSPGCKYCMIRLIFDQSLISTPPHSISDEQLQELFGSRCDIETVDEIDALDHHHIKWGLNKADERLSVLTLKPHDT